MFVTGRPAAVAARQKRRAMANVTQDRDRHENAKAAGGHQVLRGAPRLTY